MSEKPFTTPRSSETPTREELLAWRAAWWDGPFQEAKDRMCDALLAVPSATELESQRDNLAMLVRMLTAKVRNLSPDSSLADRAMNYLCSKGLQGSVLREETPPPEEKRKNEPKPEQPSGLTPGSNRYRKYLNE